MALSPAGLEFRVNSTTAADQYAPAIASDNAGNFVVVWVSDGLDGSGLGIYAQRYNASGVAQGSEFRVNNYTTGNQYQPAVAMDADGDFVVVWTSDSAPGGSLLDVLARRYDPAGNPKDANEFLVNTTTNNNQESPSVAMDAAGNFVIVWDSNGNSLDTSSYGVIARRYNAAGTALGGEFLVNQTTAGFQGEPSIAMSRDGLFVVAWTSGDLAAPNYYDIFARRYDASGIALGNEFLVNTYTTDYQMSPAAAMDTDGDFIIVWEGFGQDAASTWGIYLQRYSSAGAAVGSEFLVNTTTANDQRRPAIDMSARGDYTVVWQSPDSSDTGVFFRSFDYTGAQVNAQTRINATQTNAQSFPAITHDANGNAVFAWQSNLQDSSGWGVYARRYTAPDQLPPTVTAATFNYLTSQSVTLSFSESVSPSFTIADVTVQNLTTSSMVSTSLAYSGVNPATITFSGLLADGNYRLTLMASGITDAAGNQLDGDNNGAPGGNYTFDFFILGGDADHDRDVDNADFGAFFSHFGQSSGATWADGNFDYDGDVDNADFGIFFSRFNMTLPAPAPAMIQTDASVEVALASSVESSIAAAPSSAMTIARRQVSVRRFTLSVVS